MINKREIAFAMVSGILALVAVVTMPYLVARPKLLFGRSLSAITPTLFPYIILCIVALLSVALVYIASRQLKAINMPGSNSMHWQTDNPWLKKGGFFVLLAGYGLMLKPLGFLVSSFIVISATSLLLGNRHWVQIALLAFLSPVLLYLLATRGMLVSLPELDQIELFYSRVIASMRSISTP